MSRKVRKTPTKKVRNRAAQDATLINVHALRRAINKVVDRLNDVDWRLKKLERVYAKAS